MWTDLKGWDKPTRENAARAARFERAVFSDAALSMSYRFFRPEAARGVPLLVFLHGADVAGSDNEAQLSAHDIGTLFADKAWQDRHPCVILAPQYPRGRHWTQPALCSWLEGLIDSYIASGDADRGRVYLYGYSAGAIGIYELIRRRPGFYAAAIPICGSTTDREIELLLDTPMWLFHAEDDTIVRCGLSIWSTGECVYLGSARLYERLAEKSRAELHYTEYPLGQMQERYHLHTHCSWVPAGQDTKAWEWMFSQRRS